MAECSDLNKAEVRATDDEERFVIVRKGMYDPLHLPQSWFDYYGLDLHPCAVYRLHGPFANAVETTVAILKGRSS